MTLHKLTRINIAFKFYSRCENDNGLLFVLKHFMLAYSTMRCWTGFGPICRLSADYTAMYMNFAKFVCCIMMIMLLSMIEKLYPTQNRVRSHCDPCHGHGKLAG